MSMTSMERERMMDVMVRCMALGSNVVSACARAGTDNHNFYLWRKRHPEFARKLEQASRGELKVEGPMPPYPTSSGPRHKYQDLFDQENDRNPGKPYREYLREWNKKMAPVRAEARRRARDEKRERAKAIKAGIAVRFIDEEGPNQFRSYPQGPRIPHEDFMLE